MDQNGNLFFVPNSSNTCLYKIQPIGGQIPVNPTMQKLVCGFATVEGLAVDAAGNVWESDFYNGLVEVQAINGAVTASSTLQIWSGGSGFGLGLDENGSVFASLYPVVEQFDFSDPPSFTWSGTTNIGQTNGTVNTAFAANADNRPLQIVVPDSGNNPSINANWTWNTSAAGACPSASSGLTADQAPSIAPSALCMLPISFAPKNGGNLSGQLTFTDDNLYVIQDIGSYNPNDATQSVTLSGTAGAGTATPTISWTPTTPITNGATMGSGDFNATATVSSTNVSADGTFAYYLNSVGGSPISASTVLFGGTNTVCVQWTPSSSFTATYSASSYCTTVQVNAASTSIMWTPTSPISKGTALGAAQFNATASSGSTPVSSDGTFTYYLNVVGGTVANSSTVLPAGSNTVCVQWSPSSTYSADYDSSQACTTIQVNAGSTINWTPSTPITYSSTLGNSQFNATAYSGATNISVDGTFTYYISSVGGTVANSTTVLPGGTDTLCVQWVPSSNFTSQYSSVSQCLPITVNAASTSVSWSPSSSTIIASSGPTSAQFDAAALTGATNVTVNGTATYHLSTPGGTPITIGTAMTPGPVTICAVWAPSSGLASDYVGNSTCQNFTVINTQPTTSVATNGSPVFLTTSVTFTATVTPTSGSIVPTGSVTFLDGTTSIGTGTLSASGSGASAVAKLTTGSLAAGTHSITASYAGDTNNQGSSTTVTLPQVIEDFSVVAGSPTSSTVVPGTSATFNLTVSPVAQATTFPATITLTAAGLPSGATYSFSPASIATGAGSTPVTLTITTPITTLARNRPPSRWPLAALALLLLPLAGKLRRAGRGLSRMTSIVLMFAAGLAAMSAFNGCGGVPSGYFGQAQATSSITVTGTSGSLTHNASVSLTVE